MFEIQDYPMKCCGMLQASGISVEDLWESFLEADGRHREGVTKQMLLEKINERQRAMQRNCAMLTISEYQKQYADWGTLLEKDGWQLIQTVWNPNSGNNFHIYTKVLWQDYAAWQADVAAGKQPDLSTRIIRGRQHWPCDELECVS